jgi:hypothetical protein
MVMKKFLYLPIFILLLVAPGCGLDIIEITITEEGQASLTGGLSFPNMGSFAATMSKTMSNNDINPDDVDSLKLVSSSISLKSEYFFTKDLSFLKTLEIQVSAPDLQPEIIASATTFEAGNRKKELGITENLELKPYLNTGSMTVSVDTSINSPPREAVLLEISLTFRVDVNVL